MRTSATASHVPPLREQGSGGRTTGIIGCRATKMREKSPAAFSEEGKNGRTRTVVSRQPRECWTCLAARGALRRCPRRWQCWRSSRQRWRVPRLQRSWCSVARATFCPIPCTALACSRTFHSLKQLVLVIPTVPLLPDKKFRTEVPWDPSRGERWCLYKAVSEVRLL